MDRGSFPSFSWSLEFYPRVVSSSFDAPDALPCNERSLHAYQCPCGSQLIAANQVGSISAMSFSRRIATRIPTRRLQHSFPTRCLGGGRQALPAAYLFRSSKVSQEVSLRTWFSTMSALKSNAPAMVGGREFDTEIKDMANYVHNYKIDSDLAVRRFLAKF